MPSIHHSIFDDPLFGDGADPAPPPPKPAWPREDIHLGHFTGSTEFFKWSVLFPRCILTEGTQYVAEKLGAYWLMDIIGSAQLNARVKATDFQHWKIQVTHGPPPPRPWWGADPDEELQECSESWALVTATNGNDREIYSQLVPYTDFGLQSLEMYACRNELGGVTIMLKSEY